MAATLQEPVPVPEVVTVMEPDAALPRYVPEAAPQQSTLVEMVAPEVDQLKVLVPPETTEALLNQPDAVGGAQPVLPVHDWDVAGLPQ